MTTASSPGCCAAFRWANWPSTRSVAAFALGTRGVMGCTVCVRETTIDHSEECLAAIFQPETVMRTSRPRLLLFVFLLGSHACPGGMALAEADWWSLRELVRPRV